MTPQPRAIASRYLWLILLLALLYAAGLGGIFFIDDAPNLDGMVQRGVSAWDFIFGGSAGPLGRPVALLTFWWQRHAYPSSTTPFLVVNIAIHLANVLLLAWAVQRLQRLAPQHLGDHPWLAFSVGLVWGLMPILASASLMVVQRMTTLSAGFVLLGLHAYLWACCSVQQQRVHRTLCALALLAVCTALSALSKENGALLPLLLLVLHYTVLRAQPLPASVARWALLLALWLPALLLLGYIASRLPTIAQSYRWRAFTLDERLASQAVVLWEYLRVAWMPVWSDLSPFRDDYPVRSFSDTVVQVALAAWGLVLLAGGWLWRTGRPWLAFAVGWFLAGHVLESSVFALFLYFEHRNYVPLMGPVLAAVVLFYRLPLRGWLRPLLGGAYVVFLALVLWQTASTWGQRQLLAWAQLHPDSPRALQMLAGAYMQAGKVPQVLQMYATALERQPFQVSVALQGLRAACYMRDDGQSISQWWPRARDSAATGIFSHLSLLSLQATQRLQAHGGCAGLEPAHMLSVLAALESNPVYGRRNDRIQIYQLRAKLLAHTGDNVAAIEQLQQALQLRSDVDTVAQLLPLHLQTQGYSATLAWISALQQTSAPAKDRARAQWFAALQHMEKELRAQRN